MILDVNFRLYSFIEDEREIIVIHSKRFKFYIEYRR